VKALLLAVALLGLWQLYAGLGGIDPLILPAPSEIAEALWRDRALLGDNLLVTAGEVVLGLLAALVVGLAFATGIHLSRTLRGAVYPLLVASQTIPIVIIAPLLIAWFGFDVTPKVAIVALLCFFPITVTTLDALAGVDPEARKLLRTLDASRAQVFRFLEAPAALPGAISGAKVAVAVALIAAVLAEQAGSSEGLGHLLLQAVPQLETARAYAAVVLLSVMALALFGGLTLLERRWVPWSNRVRGGRS
jgi:putative hydroxymethylpyrimidine transport system permease protein